MIKGTLSKAKRVLKARWHVLFLLWLFSFLPALIYGYLVAVGIAPNIYELTSEIYARPDPSTVLSDFWNFWFSSIIFSQISHLLYVAMVGWADAFFSGLLIAIVSTFLNNRSNGFWQMTSEAAKAVLFVWAYFLVIVPITSVAMHLVIPGLWLKTIWFVAIVAALCERSAPVAAARRSFGLTRDYRWKILVFVIAIWVTTILINQARIILLGSGILGPGDNTFLYVTVAKPYLEKGVSFLSLILICCAYWHLRELKGDTPEPSIANTFS